MIPGIDYSLIERTPDGTGKIFDTTVPKTGAYVRESVLKNWILADALLPADIVNDLTTADPTKVLSAEQGTVLKQLIDAVSGGITPKGDILSSNLPPADASNKGWQYYCTDINKWATSDGTQWIMTSNSIIVQTPDATDTGHALSNAVVTQCCNEVKANVQNNSQRITNIENALSGTVIQEHVDSTQKNVKTILSADELLPWAILKRVGARTERLNQLVKNGNFAQGTSEIMPYNPTYTQVSVSDGVLTHTILPNGATYPYEVGVNLICLEPKNRYHKFLYAYKAKPSLAVPIRCELGGGATTMSDTLVANEWNFVANIATAFDQYGTAMLLYPFTTPTSMTVQYKDVVVRDLTDLFGSGYEPTVETIMSDYPWLLQYSDVSIGTLIDLPPTSFLYRGTNQWDEDFLAHFMWTTSGSKQSAENWNCSNSMYKCLPSTQYYFMINNKATFYVAIIWFDANGNYVDDNEIFSAGYKTSPANAYYFALNIAISEYGGTTYNHDIMVCLNSVTNKTYKPYNGQTIDTSFMAGKKYVNSSCYDYAENIYVNGILKRKMQTVVGSVDLGQISFSQFSGVYYANLLSYGFKVHGALMCDKYFKSDKNFAELGEGEISSNNVGFGDAPYIFIKDSNGTPTGTLYYELATLPDPTYGDPIPNIPCEDGSTITAITPQTDIVNAIDVPSTIGYSTKIA